MHMHMYMCMCMCMCMCRCDALEQGTARWEVARCGEGSRSRGRLVQTSLLGLATLSPKSLVVHMYAGRHYDMRAHCGERIGEDAPFGPDEVCVVTRAEFGWADLGAGHARAQSI